ncbi:MAG: zinc ABC transporter substrate-binding protein [Pseudomonadales bacterium]|nr:zinc ABC transporter substrate-binding protein [Pseudomonadales bacterium]
MNRIHLLLLLLLTALPVSQSTAQVQVLASIKPLQLIVAAITDGVSTPGLLISGNQSYHHFTLRPSSVRAVNAAQLLVWVGPELETYLTDLYQEQASKKPVLQMTALPGLIRHPRLETALPQQAEETQSEHVEAEHAHRHAGEYDGHVWLDTRNAALLAVAVSEQLQALDPDHAARYAANLERFQQALAALARQTAALMAPLTAPVTTAEGNRPFAVYHNAFQYFEKQYGLRASLVFVEEEDVQPGIRHLLALRESLAEIQPGCLLQDVGANPATVATVLGDYVLKRQTVDIIGLTLAAEPGAFVQLLSGVAADFQSCLQP